MQLIITVLSKKVQLNLALDQIMPGINDGPCLLAFLFASGVSTRLPDAYSLLLPRHSSTLFNHSCPGLAILAPSRGAAFLVYMRPPPPIALVEALDDTQRSEVRWHDRSCGTY
jgi:hypothetical protein